MIEVITCFTVASKFIPNFIFSIVSKKNTLIFFCLIEFETVGKQLNLKQSVNLKIYRVLIVSENNLNSIKNIYLPF